MNVYVRELSRELGRMGVVVDVFTRSQNPTIPRVVSLGDRARVVHLAAGPRRRWRASASTTTSTSSWTASRRGGSLGASTTTSCTRTTGCRASSASTLRERWGVPVLQMFHTLARLKNRVAAGRADLEPDVRIGEETRVIAEVDRVVAANVVERAHLVRALRRPTAERIAVIPCGVDTELFAPGDRAAARAALGLAGARPCSTSVAWRRSRGSRRCSTRVAPLRAAGMPELSLLVVGGEADEPVSGHEGDLRERCTPARPREHGAVRPRPAPGGPAHLLRRRRRDRAALALRVVRHGGARGDGLRRPGDRLPRRWAHHDRPRRRHRAPRARGRRRRARRRGSRRCSATRICAGAWAARASGGPPSTGGRAWPRRSVASTRRSTGRGRRHLAAARCHE